MTIAGMFILAAGHEDALLCGVGYPSEVEVAGNYLVEGVDNADKRLFADVFRKMPRRVEKRSRIGMVNAGKNFTAVKFHYFIASFAASIISFTLRPYASRSSAALPDLGYTSRRPRRLTLQGWKWQAISQIAEERPQK